jgi:hypothetical protein
MAKRTLHPTNKARSLRSKEQAIRHPRTWAKDMEGTEDELEAEAVAQFDEERREHIPGLALSDIPCRFFVRCKPRGSQTVYLSKYWRDPSKWQDAHAELLDPLNYGLSMEPLVPKRWSYAKLLADAKPERFDLANPRVYSLTGKQMPMIHPPGQVGTMLTATFEHMLADLFRTAPTNSKRAEVAAFLDHHHTKGGNAQALTDYLERMLEHWKKNPPQYTDLHKLERVTVEGVGQLTTLVEQWLANTPRVPGPAKRTTSAKDKPKPPTLADKLGQVSGAAERFMALVVGAGLCHASGEWIPDIDTKGSKAKLIAAWDAVVKVLGVPNFDTATALVAALKGHFDGLEGLEAPHKVRKRYTYSDQLEEYIKDLSETK